ncbi:MAG: thioredoxin family protein [Pseudomonadota bacterium]
MSVSREENRDSTSRDLLAAAEFSRLAEGSYHARLAGSSGIGIVLFTSPHCGACRAWKQLLPQALAGLAAEFHEVDVSEATGVARYFGIFHLPTIYLYRDGRFHAELQCEARPTTIRQVARQLLAAPPQDEP